MKRGYNKTKGLTRLVILTKPKFGYFHFQVLDQDLANFH